MMTVTEMVATEQTKDKRIVVKLRAGIALLLMTDSGQITVNSTMTAL
jgi:hypothetical protein